MKSLPFFRILSNFHPILRHPNILWIQNYVRLIYSGWSFGNLKAKCSGYQNVGYFHRQESRINAKWGFETKKEREGSYSLVLSASIEHHPLPWGGDCFIICSAMNETQTPFFRKCPPKKCRGKSSTDTNLEYLYFWEKIYWVQSRIEHCFYSRECKLSIAGYHGKKGLIH